MLYELRDATVSVGGEEILSHIDFYIKDHEKIAVVGRNGTGKTTLLKLISGELTCDRDDKREGQAVSLSRSVEIGMLSQVVFDRTDITVYEELLKGYHEREGEENALAEYQRERFLYESEFDRLLTGFGFSKEDKNKKISEFSGGQQTKLAFIRLLLKKPDILLLDEPTNNLDIESVEWLEAYLRSYEKAVVFVSHDRFFMDMTAEVVIEVSDKSLTRYTGSYSAYKEEKRRRQVKLLKQYEQAEAEKRRLSELIERFRNKPRKASMARAKKKQLDRMTVNTPPPNEELISFDEQIQPAVLGAKWVYEAEHLSVGYDLPLYELGLRIRRGTKLAVIGANGCGKTALLKTVAGLIPPIKGKSTLGNQIQIGYFDQQSAAISSDKTVLCHFTSLFPGLTDKSARKELAKWLFKGEAATKPVDALSGGEKARLVMAELLYSRPNFLILDEPTNHMDIQAKEVLEEAFKAYTGTLIFVSHDRYMCDRVADSLLIIKGGEVYYYPFSYRHYLTHIERGEDTPPGQMKAEDAALIAGLKAVPKRGSLLGHELSSDEAYAEWQKDMLKREYEELYDAFIAKLQESSDIASQLFAENEFTEALIELYLRETSLFE